jgi:hypothetical protein
MFMQKQGGTCVFHLCSISIAVGCGLCPNAADTELIIVKAAVVTVKNSFSVLCALLSIAQKIKVL